jgi:hypothetical protein
MKKLLLIIFFCCSIGIFQINGMKKLSCLVGLEKSYSFTDPLTESLSQIGYCNTIWFPVEYYCIGIKKDDSEDGLNIHRIVLNLEKLYPSSTDTGEDIEDDLNLYASNDNSTYSLISKASYSINTEISPAIDDIPAKVTITIDGLNISQKYIKLRCPGNGESYNGVFGNDNAQSIISAYRNTPSYIIKTDLPQFTAGSTAFEISASGFQNETLKAFYVSPTGTLQNLWTQTISVNGTATHSGTMDLQSLPAGKIKLRFELFDDSNVLIDRKDTYVYNTTGLVSNNLATNNVAIIVPETNDLSGTWFDKSLTTVSGDFVVYRQAQSSDASCSVSLPDAGWCAIYVGLVGGDSRVVVSGVSPAPSFSKLEYWRNDIPPADDAVGNTYIGCYDLSGGKTITLMRYTGTTPLRITHVIVHKLSQAKINIVTQNSDFASRIIQHNDGYSGFYYGILNSESALQDAIGYYSSIPIFSYDWCLGTTTVFNIPTTSMYNAIDANGTGATIGNNGVDPADYRRDGDRLAGTTVQSLLNNGINPLSVICDKGDLQGTDVNVTLRMGAFYSPDSSFSSNGPMLNNADTDNDGVIDSGSNNYCQRKLDLTYEWKLSYAYPEVRSHILSTLTDAVTGSDVDGVHLQFLRHPPFFGYDQPIIDEYIARYGSFQSSDYMNNNWQQIQRDIMTDLVEDIYDMVQANAPIGKTIKLKVSFDQQNYYRQGLDVAAWVAAGWVDVISPGCYVVPAQVFDLAPFVSMVNGTSCKIFVHSEATILGKDPTPEEENGEIEIIRVYMSTNQFKKYFMDMYEQGADGLYPFNYNGGTLAYAIDDMKDNDIWRNFVEPFIDWYEGGSHDYIDKKILAYFKLDEGVGTTTKDEMENIADGTVNNVSWPAGVSGSAIYCDGDGDDVNFGTSAELDMTGSFTISAWINPVNTSTAYRVIVAKSIWGYGLFTEGTRLRGWISGSTTNATSHSIAYTITPGVWQHVAMTFDINGDKKIHLYVNGEEVEHEIQQALVGNPVDTSNWNFTIGSDNDRYWFYGSIDEVKIFETALSAKEIFNEFSTVLSVDFNDIVEDKANEGSFANNGTISGAKPTIGKSGSAFRFDGVDDYVDFGYPDELELTGSRTISAWINPDNVNTGYRVIAGKYLWGSCLFTDGTRLRGWIAGSEGNASSHSYSGAITPGVWQHVAMTFDVNGDKKIHLYINGEEIDHEIQTAMVGTPTSTSAYKFTIGSNYNSQYFFDGKIDEIKVFNQSLSKSQILAQFATVLSTNFNEGNGNKANDASMGNHGTISGADWDTSGKVGNALDFNGTSDYVDFGYPAELELTGSRTLSAWIKLDDVGTTYNAIIAKYLWGSCLFTDGTRLRGWIAGSEGNASSHSYSGAITPGVWQHVAMTFDVNGDKKIHLYINGEEIDHEIQTAMVGTPASTSAYKFTIGSNYNSQYFFDGKIDEVKVFDQSLSKSQILDQFATVLSLNFDENDGSTVHDVRMGNHGTINDATSWTASGKAGSALDFDGTSDYVDFGYPDELELTGSRTISAWINPDNVNTGYRVIAGKYIWGSCLFTDGTRLRGWIAGSGSNASSWSYLNTITPGEWQHVAMTFDINGDKKIHLYVNGEEVQYATQSDMDGIPTSTSAYKFIIGKNYDTQYFFDGKIDEVKVFDQSLSADTIDEIYQSY